MFLAKKTFWIFLGKINGYKPLTFFAKMVHCRCLARSYIRLCLLWKVSKYLVFSGPYFLVFGLNTERKSPGKYRPEKTPYLDTFHTVCGLNLNTAAESISELETSKKCCEVIY